MDSLFHGVLLKEFEDAGSPVEGEGEPGPREIIPFFELSGLYGGGLLLVIFLTPVMRRGLKGG